MNVPIHKHCTQLYRIPSCFTCLWCFSWLAFTALLSHISHICCVSCYCNLCLLSSAALFLECSHRSHFNHSPSWSAIICLLVWEFLPDKQSHLMHWKKVIILFTSLKVCIVNFKSALTFTKTCKQFAWKLPR